MGKWKRKEETCEINREKKERNGNEVKEAKSELKKKKEK